MNNRKIWSHLDLIADSDIREVCRALCWECDATGIEEDVPSAGADRIYFESSEAVQRAVARLDAFSERGLRYQIGTVSDPGWRTAWHDFFKPITAGQRFRILPHWADPDSQPDDGRISLRIHPGQAFGTGGHESTRLCIRLMEFISFREQRVLDAGCGSGVLGIAAALSGASAVVGWDIEMEAVDEAAENAAINGCQSLCEWHAGDVLAENRCFDTVLANLNTVLLKALNEALIQRLNPGGRLIISGFLHRDHRAVETAYLESQCMECLRRDTMGEWAAALMKRIHVD